MQAVARRAAAAVGAADEAAAGVDCVDWARSEPDSRVGNGPKFEVKLAALRCNARFSVCQPRTTWPRVGAMACVRVHNVLLQVFCMHRGWMLVLLLCMLLVFEGVKSCAHCIK